MQLHEFYVYYVYLLGNTGKQTNINFTQAPKSCNSFTSDSKYKGVVEIVSHLSLSLQGVSKILTVLPLL